MYRHLKHEGEGVMQPDPDPGNCWLTKLVEGVGKGKGFVGPLPQFRAPLHSVLVTCFAYF
jgi:hypothetical protein